MVVSSTGPIANLYRNYESTLSSNAACWKLTFALLTHAECIKCAVYSLLSVDVPVLPYYILL